MSAFAPKVAVIDLDVGNIYSVLAACRGVGLDPELTTDPGLVAEAAGAILPGVGAFPAAMAHLSRTRLDEALVRRAEAGGPILGICLGLQLLMERGTEFEDHAGLGLVPGTVESLTTLVPGGGGSKVPHVGWAPVTCRGGDSNAWRGTPLGGVNQGEHFYFVHSFFVRLSDPRFELARSVYAGRPFTAAVRSDSTFGVQFHPERSGELGLTVYRSFAGLLPSS